MTCVLFVAASLATAQEQASDEAAVLRSYYSGNGFLNRGNYDLAAEEYRSFLKEHASHEKAPVARYGLGVSLYRLGKHEAALAELQKLEKARSFPYAAEVGLLIGQSYMALENWEDAATSFEQMLRQHRGHDLADDAAALQAESLYRMKKYEQVSAPCRLLVEAWPDSPRRERADLYWGLSMMALQDYESAAELFDGMTQRFGRGQFADQTALLFAQSLHRSGDANRAVNQYLEVIKRNRAEYTPDALYGVGLLLHQTGNQRKPGPYLDQLLQNFADHRLVPDAHVLRGRVYFDEGEYERAVQHFQPVSTQAGPLQDNASYWLAKCDLRLDRPDKAAQRLASTISKFPESELVAEMTFDHGVAQLRADQADAAMQTLEGFRKRFPQHTMAADALQLMAVTEHQRKNYPESLQLCVLFMRDYSDHKQASLIKFLAGENAFLPKDYVRAERIFREFLETFPKDAQAEKARYRLGMAIFHQDRLDEAETVLSKVLAGDKTSEAYRPALLALGDGHFQNGDWARAEKYLQDYVSFGLGQAGADDALLKLGLARHRQEKFELALEAYDQLIRKFPDSPHRNQAVFERGQALVSLGNQEQADKAFAQVVDNGTDSRFSVHALNHMGVIAVRNKNYVAAAGHFGKVADIHPEYNDAAEARYQQGQALMSAEKFGDAANVFGVVLSDYGKSPRVPEASAMEVIALARAGQHQQSLAKVKGVESRHLAKLKPELATAFIYEKAWSQRELDQPEEANKTYRALLRQPGEGGLHHNAMVELAELEFDAGRFDKATESLVELRQVKSQGKPVENELHEQATYRLGVCYFNLDKFQDAAATLDEFVKNYPNSKRMASASLFCGDALFKLGRHSQAVSHLQRVVDKYADDENCAPSLLRLGECLSVLQRFKKAEAAFDQYLSRFGDSDMWYQARFGVAWAQENQGRHDDAIGNYRMVVDRHQGPTAARSQFQIGECLYAQRKFEEATRELLKVDILYAYPEWSAAALFEAGRCFEELSNPVEAKKQFEKVVQEHGGTDWAQMSSQRLQALSRSHLPGH